MEVLENWMRLGRGDLSPSYNSPNFARSSSPSKRTNAKASTKPPSKRPRRSFSKNGKRDYLKKNKWKKRKTIVKAWPKPAMD
jgi:hypothetical protein